MIDREVDLLSVLCVGQTYEGLIDEVLGIEGQSIEVSNVQIYPDEKVIKEMKLENDGSTSFDLSDAVPLFSETRNKNFNAVGSIFSRKLEEIKNVAEDNSQKDLEEATRHVQKIKSMNIIPEKQLI